MKNEERLEKERLEKEESGIECPECWAPMTLYLWRALALNMNNGDIKCIDCLTKLGYFKVTMTIDVGGTGGGGGGTGGEPKTKKS